MLTTTAVTVLGLVTLCGAFPDHSGQCTDSIAGMAMGMGGSDDPSLGWILQSDTATYTPGQPLTISLVPSEANPEESTFAGLLLYARATNNAHVGTWDTLPDGFNTLDDQCSQYGLPKSTVSHSSPDQKPGPAKFGWTAPGVGVGTVQFRGLVVTTDKVTWMQLAPLQVGATGGAAGNLSTGIVIPDDDDGNATASNTTATPTATPTAGNSATVSYMTVTLTVIVALLFAVLSA